MNARRVSAMYFSATGTTKRIVLAVAGRIARAWGEELRLEDFTLPQGGKSPAVSKKETSWCSGRPGLCRRVPNVLLSYIRVSQAEAPWPSPWCATETGIMTTRSSNCATCWRRLASGPSRQGHLWASTRSPASSGAGRPDAEDIAKAEEFAERILQLPEPPAEGRQPVEVNGCSPYRPYYVPKDRNGQPVNILKDKPKVGEGCTNCGLCVLLCPIGSIVPGNVGEYRGICIKCGACVKGCPADARYYDSYNYLYHKEELELGFTRRAEPELFF